MITNYLKIDNSGVVTYYTAIPKETKILNITTLYDNMIASAKDEHIDNIKNELSNQLQAIDTEYIEYLEYYGDVPHIYPENFEFLYYDGTTVTVRIKTEEFNAHYVQIYTQYLKDTDWVEPYLIKHYTGIELLDKDSSKFEIERKRKEAREFIRANS